MSFASEYWLLNSLLFIFGVTILVKGSDWFVDAAAALARSFKVSELVIGLTLVSIGTSLPELASSLCASFYGESDFIIGNIVGSNIANIALILGIALLLGGKMAFARKLIWRDMLFLLLTGLVLMGWFFLGPDMPDGMEYGLGRIGGILLLIACVVYSWSLIRQPSESQSEGGKEIDMSRCAAAGLIVLALIMITSGAKLMVDNVVWFAEKMHISELVISLTVVAIGTSLPELAVTVSGVLKKREDIALGNIIGSGIYNILLIIGCCAAVAPLAGDRSGSLSSMIIMNAVALLLWIFMLTGKKLHRWQGGVFFLGYILFIIWGVCCIK